jgi:hypothetical protein
VEGRWHIVVDTEAVSKDYPGLEAQSSKVKGANAMSRSKYSRILIGRARLWLLISLLLIVGILLPDSAVAADEPVPAPASEQPEQRRIATEVTSITPNSGYMDEQVSITNLAGSDFETGAGVALIKGSSVISATNVVVVSSSRITCDFDLTGAAVGRWTVRVVNPGGEYAELVDGFSVKGRVYLPIIMRMEPISFPRTLFAVEDAMVRQGYPTTNAGNRVDMWAGYDDYMNPDGQIVRSLIKFDLSDVPAGVSISSASLNVRLYNSWDYPGRSRTITTYRIGSSWSESSVTWNTSPSIGESYGSTLVTHDVVGKWYSFDVTDLVRGWANGSYTNYGVMLRGPEWSGSDSSWKAFYTSESSSDPYLEITYVGDAVSAKGPTVKQVSNSQVESPMIVELFGSDLMEVYPCQDQVGDGQRCLLGALLGAPGYRVFEPVESGGRSSD